MKRPVLPVKSRMDMPVGKEFYIFDFEIVPGEDSPRLRLDLRPRDEIGEDFSILLPAWKLDKITETLGFDVFKASCLNKLILVERIGSFSRVLKMSRIIVDEENDVEDQDNPDF